MENKKSYIAPQIEIIELDYEISLALESAPPVGPSESLLLKQEFLNNDIFRDKMA